MQDIFHDRLYGQIHLSKADVKLLEQPRIARLRRVSLSAIPSEITNFSKYADRGEHGIGAGYLATQLHSDFEGFRSLIHRSLFLHDSGHPPFSHTTEPYLQALTQKNHEAITEEILLDSKVKQIIQQEDIFIEDVISMIKGDYPLIGKLVNGSIDLDNLDNTLRYGLSGGVVRAMPYSPIILAQAFRIVNGRLVLHSHSQFEIAGWKNLRDEVYKMVYDDGNLSGGMMLQRAIDLTYQEDQIKPTFFSLTDDEALEFLRNQTNPRSKRLVEDALRRNFYERIFFQEFHLEPEGKIKEFFQNWRGRQKLADDLASEVRIDPAQVCTYVGKSRGPKSITLPFWNEEEGFIDQPFQHVKESYMVKVYLDPKVLDKREAISEIMSSLL